MSNNRKNNHYHYAEKYDRVIRRKKSSRTAYLPFKAVIASLVVLLMFGLVSTTFGAYITESEPEYNPEEPGIISEVRNIKATRDTAITGRNVSLAETGATWSFSGTSYIYFDNKSTNWSGAYFYLVIGKSSYSSTYAMTALSKTGYYYCQLPSSGWSDATYMAIAVRETYDYGSGNWGSGNINASNFKYYSGTYTSGLSASNGQRYILTPGSTSNGCTLSLSNNDNLTTVNLKAHACYSTNGTSYTSDNSTGGTVDVKGYYMTNNTTVSALSAAGAGATASYDSVRTTASYKAQFVAAAATSSSYVFKGWYTAATGGSLVSSSATYNYDVNSGNKEIYARFLKQVTVKTAKNPTSYNQTLTPSATGTTVDAGTEVTLNANVMSGVTFGGWTFSGTKTFKSGYSASSNPCIIIPTTNVTATAKYTLQVPTSLSLSYPTFVAGDANGSTPTYSANSPSSGTLNYSFTNITPKSGTTAASGTYSVDSSTGVVTASTPGKYIVTMSVTTTAYGLTSSPSTTTAEVMVKPQAPDASLIRFTIDGYTDDYTEGTTGTVYSTPAKIPINSENFTITAWLSSTTTGYSYNWSNTAGTYNTSTGAVTAISGLNKTSDQYRVIDLCTDSDTALKVDADGHYAYVMNVYTSYNGVSSDATTKTLYYEVISDFLDIQWMSFTEDSNDYQKIYAEDNGITDVVSKIRAGGTTFNTISWFSPDNINYKTVELWSNALPFTNSYGTFTSAKPNDAAHRTSDKQETFDVSNIMQYLGAKWIRIYMNDTGNGKTAAATRYIHTTVGTSSTVADRPIYYLDNTGITYTNSRIMAFYLRESDATPTVRYQTAQQVKRTVNGTEVTYNRFYIPEDATQITFAHVANNNYVLPTINNGTLTYTVYTDHTVLMAWTTPIDLTDSANVGKTLYKATAYTTGANDINNYTGSMLTLD